MLKGRVPQPFSRLRECSRVFSPSSPPWVVPQEARAQEASQRGLTASPSPPPHHSPLPKAGSGAGEGASRHKENFPAPGESRESRLARRAPMPSASPLRGALKMESTTRALPSQAGGFRHLLGWAEGLTSFLRALATAFRRAWVPAPGTPVPLPRLGPGSVGFCSFSPWAVDR